MARRTPYHPQPGLKMSLDYALAFGSLPRPQTKGPAEKRVKSPRTSHLKVDTGDGSTPAREGHPPLHCAGSVSATAASGPEGRSTSQTLGATVHSRGLGPPTLEARPWAERLNKLGIPVLWTYSSQFRNLDPPPSASVSSLSLQHVLPLSSPWKNF